MGGGIVKETSACYPKKNEWGKPLRENVSSINKKGLKTLEKI